MSAEKCRLLASHLALACAMGIVWISRPAEDSDPLTDAELEALRDQLVPAFLSDAEELLAALAALEGVRP